MRFVTRLFRLQFPNLCLHDFQWVSLKVPSHFGHYLTGTLGTASRKR